MAFTQRTVTHQFTNADGTPASGSVTCVLTKRMTNSGQTVAPGEVTTSLSGSGAMSVSLFANNDTGTTPGDAEWAVTIRINGVKNEEYFVTVPTGSGSLDLGTLLPEAAQVN